MNIIFLGVFSQQYYEHGLYNHKKSIVINRVSIGNNPPEIIINGPYTGKINESIEFDASNSYDPDGDIIEAYLWNFGDGTQEESETVYHTYQSYGNYTIELTIQDTFQENSTIITYAKITEIGTDEETKDNLKNEEIKTNTPGFNFIFVFIALTILFFYKQKREKN